jgi:mannose-6-phosphate isomerase-like protein (cupin superfamily)
MGNSRQPIIPAKAGTHCSASHAVKKWAPACAGVGMREDMPSTAWQTQQIDGALLVAAPDGSQVRILCATARGSMISFSLDPGAVSKAVAHKTVEEIWYVVAGRGRLWRRQAEAEEVTDLASGLSLTIPIGAQFQFRNDGDQPLQIVAVTMPPWPGEGEAVVVIGAWAATI